MAAQADPAEEKQAAANPKCKTMREVCNLAMNNVCADCDEKKPDWISMNLGICVCIKCAGIHRNLGVDYSKVRSLELDDCADPEVIEYMQSVGNIEAKKIYERHVPAYFMRPTECDSPIVRENWIRAKYVRKEFVGGKKDDDEDDRSATLYTMPERMMEGILQKQNERDVWQKRYFVLHGRFLHYFKEQTDSYPKGSLDTKNMQIVVPALDDTTKPCEFHIKVVGSNRVYILAANTIDDMFAWIHALRRGQLYYGKMAHSNEKPPAVELVPYKDMGNLVLEGEVFKQGGKWKSWNKRWCVLNKAILFYFKQKPAPTDVPEGGVRITLCDVAVCKTSKKPNCFSVITEGRMFFISCPTPKEMHDWMDGIIEVLEKTTPHDEVDFAAL